MNPESIKTLLEKYGDYVRMITFDPEWSRELCGGCHVQRTGQIGYFKITSESAVSAGVRRIEAVTAEGAERYATQVVEEVNALKNVLKTKDLLKSVETLQEENRRLQKTIERMVQEQAGQLREGLKSKVKQVKGIQLVAAVIPIGDPNAVKTLAYELERELGNVVVAFGSVANEKPLLTIRISDELVKTKGLNAGNLVRDLAKAHLNGGGGGQPFFATAGGSHTEGLAAAIAAVADKL